MTTTIKEMNMVALVKEVADKVDNMGVNTVDSIRIIIEEAGITDNMHVGKPQDFFDTDDKVAEWYLGQYLSIINKQAWFAMNSLINASSAWSEKKLEETANV